MAIFNSYVKLPEGISYSNHLPTISPSEKSLEAALRKLPKAQLRRATRHLRHEGAAAWQGQPAEASRAARCAAGEKSGEILGETEMAMENHGKSTILGGKSWFLVGKKCESLATGLLLTYWTSPNL